MTGWLPMLAAVGLSLRSLAREDRGEGRRAVAACTSQSQVCTNGH